VGVAGSTSWFPSKEKSIRFGAGSRPVPSPTPTSCSHQSPTNFYKPSGFSTLPVYELGRPPVCLWGAEGPSRPPLQTIVPSFLVFELAFNPVAASFG